MGATQPTNAEAITRMPSDPLAMRILDRKKGMVSAHTAIASTRNMATATKTPRISVFIWPNSPRVARVLISLLKVTAKTDAGSARKSANEASGRTAPSSVGSMYFGTSHTPTSTLRASVVRKAQNIRSEYHQKSPSVRWMRCRKREIIRWRTCG